MRQKGGRTDGNRAAFRWTRGRRGLLIAAVAAAGAIILGWLLITQADRSSSSVPAVDIDEENGLQSVFIEVGKSGYRPAILELKAHMMTKINFRLTTRANGMARLLSPDLDLQATLKEGDNYFLIGNPQPGTYKFHSEDGKYEGILVFKEEK